MDVRFAAEDLDLDAIDVVAIAREVAEDWVTHRRCNCYALIGSIPIDIRDLDKIEVGVP